MFKLKILVRIVSNLLCLNFKSLKGLKRYQEKKIKKHLLFITNNTQFYSKYKESKLSEFPIVNKEVMMNNFNGLNTVNIHKKEALDLAAKAENSRDFSPQINGVTIGLSSGTSGNKSLFLASKEDRIKYVSAIFKKVLLPLKHRNTKVALFFRANSNLYEAVASSLISFQYFDLTEDINSHIEKLESFQPHILVAPPSLLYILAQKKEKKELNISLDKIISVAEVLEDDVKDKIERAFNQTLHQLYQCTEGFLGSTCQYGNIHLHEDYIHFEKKWLDDEKKRFHPIITDFNRTTQAMIRYELNDILHVGGPCKCGSIYTMIDKIEGRSDDIFIFNNDQKEITIFPDQIRNTILLNSDKLQNYLVFQIDNTKVETSFLFNNIKDENNEKQAIMDALAAMFHLKTGHTIKIINIPWKTPKSDVKFRRIINKNKK